MTDDYRLGHDKAIISGLFLAMCLQTLYNYREQLFGTNLITLWIFGIRPEIVQVLIAGSALMFLISLFSWGLELASIARNNRSTYVKIQDTAFSVPLFTITSLIVLIAVSLMISILISAAQSNINVIIFVGVGAFLGILLDRWLRSKQSN
ncbi:MAG: hypothetical protein Q7T16_05875 [Candidatus Burarchaeum sp.]|nr:hypothetical protein [Candidatus Burarchaeum sp.]MDO8340155.1 hypothetical protein [Candidatus Burarchaeum sp.]